MKRLASLFLLLFGCQTNPYTGRDQLILVPRPLELKLGSYAFEKALEERETTWDPDYYEPVRRVADRMISVLEAGTDGIAPPQYEWELRVIDDSKTVNAFCTPGGKIGVFTGIFPFAVDENGLAAVMGHEIMHAVLRHGAERISREILVLLGVSSLAEVLGGDDSEKKNQVLSLLGLGAALGIVLPYSRLNETEADEFGLYLAARAGYDPRAAITFWEGAERLLKARAPEFLSTHPSHETRIENMKQWMPKALEHYEKARKADAKALPTAGTPMRTPPPAKTVSVGVMNRGYEREQCENGKPALAFSFVIQKAAYVREAVLRGPAGARFRYERMIEAGALKRVQIEQDESVAPGTYRLTIRGHVDANPFEETTEYRVE